MAIRFDGREAVTHWAVLEPLKGATLLECRLETGRTHQIRVHMAFLGHPVLGDAQYGATGGFGPAHDDERLRAIALHSRSLSFRDPTSREDVTVEAPLPAPWRALDLPAAT